MADENVTLTVRGKTYEGWKEIRITRSVRAIAAGFTLSLTDNWSQDNEPWVLVPGDECEVRANGVPVLRGYVDTVDSSYTATARTLSVSGRERTGDLVDCSVDYTGQSELPNISLFALAQKLSRPFGVTVRNESGVSKPIELVSINPGDTVFNVLEKYARQDGVLLASDGLGTLRLQRIAASTAAAQLVEGENILSASASYTAKDRFSEYRVMSQTNVPGLENEAALAVEGKAIDREVGRARLKVLQGEASPTPERADARARWELSHRRAQSMKVSVRLQGWRLADGSLFEPNRLYKVKSPWIGVTEELLLEDVSLSTSASGTFAELQLTRKDAYKPEPSEKGEGNPWSKLLKEDRGGV